VFEGVSTTEQEKGRYPGNIAIRAFSLVFPLILSFVLHNQYPFFGFSISCVSFPSITIYLYLSLRHFALFTLHLDELGMVFFSSTPGCGTRCRSILSHVSLRNFDSVIPRYYIQSFQTVAEFTARTAPLPTPMFSSC
ncbi:hypothetical protein COCMIDRAFT_81236, partial [Bipolaris oryzae ATCC 44560]